MKQKRSLVLIFMLVAILALSLVLVSCDKPSYSHEHSFKAWEIFSQPTLSSEGELVRYCEKENCSAREFKKIPKLNKEDYEYKEVSKPTYDQDGKESYSIKIDEQTFTIELNIDKLSREYNEWKLLISPTKEDEGKLERISKDEASVKQEKVLPKLSNKDYIVEVISEAKCLVDGEAKYTYKIDNQEFVFNASIDKLGHDWSEWRIIGAASSNFMNVIFRNCRRCEGVFEQKEIPPITRHSVENGTYKFVPTKEATCSEEGYGVYIYEIDNQKMFFEGKISKLPHSEGEWEITNPTNDKEGLAIKHCKICNSEIEKVVLPILSSDNYEISSKESDCVTQGYDTYTLKTNKSISFTIKRVLDIENGHNYSSWTSNDWPTMEKEGVLHRECSKCGHRQEKTLPKLTLDNLVENGGVYGYVIEDTNGETKVYYTITIDGENFKLIGGEATK